MTVDDLLFRLRHFIFEVAHSSSGATAAGSKLATALEECIDARVQQALAPKATPTRFFLCERCGGTGQQVEGLYNLRTNKYDAPAGTCEACGGSGHLEKQS